MRPTTYQYATGRIWALEPKLLTFDRMERMLDAETVQEALKILSETEYGSKVSELSSPHDYEFLLASELRVLYEFIKTVTPDEESTDLFFIKYDVHNTKVLLKASFLGMEDPEFLSEMGTLPLDKLRGTLEEAFKSDDSTDKENTDVLYSDLPEYLREPLKKIHEDYTLKKMIDPQHIDVALDRAMYRYIFKVCREKRQTFMEAYFKREVDLINIRSLLRVKNIGADFTFAKEVFMPYGYIEEAILEEAFERSFDTVSDSFSSTMYFDVVDRGVKSLLSTNTFTEYERLSGNFLLDYVKSQRGDFMGIQPIAGYILAKENEIENIRVIMVGKVNNIPADKIRERLRDTYV